MKSVETLGVRLAACRRERGLSSRRMAMALGVSHEAYQQWQGDTALPDAEAVLRVCDFLEEPPHRVMQLIRGSARQMLRDALAAVAGKPRAVAARERGVRSEQEERVLAQALPVPLREGIARHGGVDPKDLTAVAVVLRQMAGEPLQRQEVILAGLVAELALEGEEAWGLPPIDPAVGGEQ